MNKELFIEEVKKIGIELTEEQLNNLNIYCEFLKEYNEHTNLTAITEDDQIYLKHFYDSLTFIKALKLDQNYSLIDIGTGAGFPGMVLKIVFPNIDLTLLDSNNKKITFLKELAEKLNIKDIKYFLGRAEDYVVNNRERFDIVTARAVSNLPVLSELCLPLVKLNGYFIALKGSNQEEIKDAEFAIKTLGGDIENIINFTLPIEGSERNILKIKKVKNTPQEYPRKYEKIIKKPLKINAK